MNAPKIQSKNMKIKTLAAAKSYVVTIKTIKEYMASASPILQAMTCFPTHTVLITWSVKRLQSRHHWTGRGQDSRKQSLMEQRQLQLVSLSICRVYQHLSLLHSPVLTLYTQFLSVLHAIRKTLQNAHQQ